MRVRAKQSLRWFSSIVLLSSGSIFGVSEVAVLERAIPRDKFLQTKKLPDWTSCDPDQRECFRVVPTRKLLPSLPASLRQSQAKMGH